MANNVFADQPAAIVAKTSISFASAGLDASKVRIIYEVGNPLKSFIPGREINAISGFTQDKGYYMVPAVDLDLSAIAAPPLDAANITPPAPTAGIVDDTANTFDWTNAAGYVTADHETSINGGTTWTAATKPLSVGNVALAIGQVLVRVKAATGRNAGPTLANASAFTVAATDTTAPTITSATAINATTIRVVFSEVVTDSITAGSMAFKKNGAANNPTARTGSGTNTIDYTVPTMAAGDTILRTYNQTSGDIKDAAGNELAAFTDVAVTNSVPAGTAAEVTAWASASGITDTTYIGYVNTFVNALKSAGIFSTHFDFIHILCGGTETKSKFNLINPADTDAAYRLTFLNTPTFAATGVTTNGTNQYINSNWIGGLSAKATSNDYHIAAYQRTSAGVDGTLWGFDESGSGQTIYTFPKAASGTGNYRDLDIAQISFTPATAKGFWISNKTATTGTLHQDGTQRANGADNGNGQAFGTVQKLTFNAYNSNGAMVTFHAAEISILSAGKSLDSTQRAAYESAVSQLATSLGL